MGGLSVVNMKERGRETVVALRQLPGRRERGFFQLPQQVFFWGGGRIMILLSLFLFSGEEKLRSSA